MKNLFLDVSVIICTYTEKRWPFLVAAVESIQRQTVAPCEIIIVIDHNESLQARVCKEISGVIVVENTEAPGLSGAKNSGIAVARGIFVAFLDDDAVAESNWLEYLYRCCTNVHVLGAGGIVTPLWAYKQPEWFPKEFNWVVGCTYGKLFKSPIEVRNPYGGCICIRREVFEVIGGFRNDIGRVGMNSMGDEETEICIRARQHWPQKVFLCEPQAMIHHYVSTHRTSWRYFCSRCYSEGLSKANVSSHVGIRDSLSSELSYTFNILPKAIAQGIAEGFFQFDPAGFLRAGVIITGLILVSAGYLAGKLSLCLEPEHSTLSAVEEIP